MMRTRLLPLILDRARQFAAVNGAFAVQGAQKVKWVTRTRPIRERLGSGRTVGLAITQCGGCGVRAPNRERLPTLQGVAADLPTAHVCWCRNFGFWPLLGGISRLRTRARALAPRKPTVRDGVPMPTRASRWPPRTGIV